MICMVLYYSPFKMKKVLGQLIYWFYWSLLLFFNTFDANLQNSLVFISVCWYFRCSFIEFSSLTAMRCSRSLYCICIVVIFMIGLRVILQTFAVYISCLNLLSVLLKVVKLQHFSNLQQIVDCREGFHFDIIFIIKSGLVIHLVLIHYY